MDNGRTALILGSSGLIGSHLTEQLLKNPDYKRITVLVRKPTNKEHLKLQEVVVDFDDLVNFREYFQVDEMYICLGTTRKKAGSKANFKKVDYDYGVEATHIAKEQGVKKLAVVSAIGSNSKSRFFYNQVKGKMEEAVAEVDISATYLFRPSLLLGEREEVRTGEKVGELLGKMIQPLLKGRLEKYQSIEGKTVAKAMIAFMKKSRSGVHIVESNLIQKIGSI
ncbi:oxidoreductase [Sutcliffiella halmapala]|uniref:oxidoreductase n=1 Tax=Sutcliffiella halmapala TaxID=79882 RepID=UPI000995D1EB|nr:oxidoreductase [Sutcliffiella halmapala]